MRRTNALLKVLSISATILTLNLHRIVAHDAAAAPISTIMSSRAISIESLEVANPGAVLLPSSQLPLTISGEKYLMTFDDEFDEDSIARSGDFNGSKWYNGVEQCCMSDSTGIPAVNYPTKVGGISLDPYNIDPKNGLEITLSKINHAWHSGVLTSVDRFGKGFSQKYGYFEIKAKLPYGLGTWPAFWMKSLSNLTDKKNLGEIDVFEQYGINDYGFCTTYHDWSSKTTPYYNCRNPTPNLTEDFHTWGFLWDEKTSAVYFDGKEINKTFTPPIMQQPYYLILDLGLGGGWPTDKTPDHCTMQIRYVRAYAHVQ